MLESFATSNSQTKNIQLEQNQQALNQTVKQFFKKDKRKRESVLL